MIPRATPQRPSEYVESALVDAILEGRYPPGSCLPGERQLAAQLGVTRPTLREAIQRLTRDGWLTVAHGKATAVNDFWSEGGLNVLGKLVEHPANLPGDFIGQLLEVRLHLAPAYTRAAVERASPQIAGFLVEQARLGDDPAAYARFDWLLHHRLTVCSGNPIYTLILNGFRGFYEEVARRYFAPAEARAVSADFYRQLGDVAAAADGPAAETLCRRVMEASLELWHRREAAEE